MSISFSDYGQWLGGYKTNGRARKAIADRIMDATFTQDIQHMIGWFYDYFHDDEPLIYKGLHPDESQTKIPINLKFIPRLHNSENKDQVGYSIQFMTTQVNPIPYYNDAFVEKWDAEFPIGLNNSPLCQR